MARCGAAVNFARQRDANEPDIVKALQAAGAAVQKLGGTGVPDLLVGYKGELFLIEVKNPNAKGGGKYNTGYGCLTDAQTKWWATWRGRAPVIVYTPDDALRAIGADP